jgi:hypothetical protein
MPVKSRLSFDFFAISVFASAATNSNGRISGEGGFLREDARDEEGA